MFEYNEGELREQLYREYVLQVFTRGEEERPHNPYDQELRETEAITNGDMEAFEESIKFDFSENLGRLAKDELRHWKNIGIVVVTLASRAAMRGGLLPEIAFSMSDVYIRQIEEMTSVEVIKNVIRKYERNYIRAVADTKAAKQGLKNTNPSRTVEMCKNYIFTHLNGKIRTADIAKALYVNPNYLSELFKKQEGITIGDFILREKMNLTKNLLEYSTHSYIEIATYLGFSSQSHLGSVFKKYTGMTLREYREKYAKQD